MAAGIKVVKRVEDETEAFEPIDVELRVLHVGMVRLNIDVGVELSGRFLRDLDEENAGLASDGR